VTASKLTFSAPRTGTMILTVAPLSKGVGAVEGDRQAWSRCRQ
jgi:hypothetical protein